MSEHTKEPWAAVDGIIYPSNGLESGEAWIADLRSASNSKANERRIVACVNACVGLTTVALERELSEEHGFVRAFQRQRDELLDELKLIANAKPQEWDEEMRDQFEQWAKNRARFAIAKAEGK